MRSKNFVQGIYNLKNPEKYVGNKSKIIYRSSWEYRFMEICEKSTKVRKWSSEPFPIPYFSPIDKKMHRYFIDFWVEYVGNDDEIKKILIEVKPDVQTKPPVLKGKSSSKKEYWYLQELKTYIINSKKWQAAEAFCKTNNLQFILITEKNLDILK